MGGCMNKMYYELAGNGEYGGYAVMPEILINFCTAAWPRQEGKAISWEVMPNKFEGVTVTIIGSEILPAVKTMAEALGIECIELPGTIHPAEFVSYMLYMEK